MRNTYGSQQSDTWLRNKVGRFSATGIEATCSYTTRKVGDKPAGSPSAQRDKYRRKLITERWTGRLTNQYVTPSMQRGSELEEEARLYYEGALRLMVEPVNFVLHPRYDFAGASPDGLVGDEGMLEIKCLEPENHIEIFETREIEPARFAQVGWQLACAERKWVDLVHYCPDIQDSVGRFMYQRIGRDDLQWKVDDRLITGEAVIDYFTSEVLKLNAEIEYFFAEHNAKPVAPFPVEIVTEDGEVLEAPPEDNLQDPAWDFLDNSLVDVP